MRIIHKILKGLHIMGFGRSEGLKMGWMIFVISMPCSINMGTEGVKG